MVTVIFEDAQISVPAEVVDLGRVLEHRRPRDVDERPRLARSDLARRHLATQNEFNSTYLNSLPQQTLDNVTAVSGHNAQEASAASNAAEIAAAEPAGRSRVRS